MFTIMYNTDHSSSLRSGKGPAEKYAVRCQTIGQNAEFCSDLSIVAAAAHRSCGKFVVSSFFRSFAAL
jgi:hypothetical protein